MNNKELAQHMKKDKATLAMYIRDGVDFATKNGIKETRDTYLDVTDGHLHGACAIGMAMLGYFKDIPKALEFREKYLQPSVWPHIQVAELVGVSDKLTLSVSANHYACYSIQSILEWLDEGDDSL